MKIDNPDLSAGDFLMTPFNIKVTMAQRELIENFSSRPGYVKGKNNHHVLNAQEKKTTRQFRLITSLTDIVRDIKMVARLISKMPPKSFRDRNDFTELDYYKYHDEVLLHKVHTAGEIMKLIVNETLNIGLTEKNCNWNQLCKYGSFNESTAKKVLQDYFDAYQKLIDDRHLNTHRGLYEDKEMDDINMYYFTYRMSKKMGTSFYYELKPELPYLKYRIKQFRKAKLSQIHFTEQSVIIHIINLFKSLRT